MRIEWIGDKGATFACLAIFTAFGAILGLFVTLGSTNPLAGTAFGAAGGLLFWSLFAVQDLRISRR